MIQAINEGRIPIVSVQLDNGDSPAVITKGIDEEQQISFIAPSLWRIAKRMAGVETPLIEDYLLVGRVRARKRSVFRRTMRRVKK